MKVHQIDFSLPTEWDRDAEMFQNEELSATSHEEATKVLERWQTDQDLDIMQVDEQIGSDLLGDELFDASCASPTGPLEELVYMNVDQDDERFFAPLLLGGDDTSCSDSSAESALPFHERYKETLEKLQASMRRSQSTRKSLQMRTDKTEQYSRSTKVKGVLTSIETSSTQLQNYLNRLQQGNE